MTTPLRTLILLPVLLLLLTGCGMLTADAPRGAGGQVTADADAGAMTLRLGDCISDIGLLGEEVDTVPVTPCDTPHEGEVYAEMRLTDPSLPEDVPARAETFCVDQLPGFLGGDPTDEYADLGLMSLYPTATSWLIGDRMIQCIVADEGGGLTGSLRGVAA